MVTNSKLAAEIINNENRSEQTDCNWYNVSKKKTKQVFALHAKIGSGYRITFSKLIRRNEC